MKLGQSKSFLAYVFDKRKSWFQLFAAEDITKRILELVEKKEPSKWKIAQDIEKENNRKRKRKSERELCTPTKTILPVCHLTSK